MKKLISIVAPMYNEESLVQEYCKETLCMTEQLKDLYDFEILLVNDGSKDATFLLMQEEQQKYPNVISIICLSRNFGLEGAVNAGIHKAVGDAVVVMDADLQDPPGLIPEMVKKWENGADIVVGSRVKRSNDNFLKKFSADLYYRVMDSLSGKLKLEKSAANFRLLSRRALDQVLELPEVNSVFRVVVPFVGMKTDIVEYDRDRRFAGSTKYNLKSMIPYALNSITGISVEPLRKIMYFIPVIVFSFLVSLLGGIFLSGYWKAICILFMGNSVLFGFLFVALTLIAEYIAQIMIEVKGRPPAIIYEYIPCKNAVERCKEGESEDIKWNM